MMNPKYSIVIASYLGEYPNAASNREQKIVRALTSAYKQSYKDMEIILVSDGCERTAEIYADINNSCDERLRFFQIERGKLWGGSPRNFGIDNARGEYITYLDIDDYIGVDHIRTIDEGIKDGLDWVWYNDLRYSGKTNSFFENMCALTLGRCGTSNVTHKRAMETRWAVDGYAHDYHLIQTLIRESQNYEKIATPQYYVCHIPHLYDL